jgi:membrane protease subunit (stomatin/prohibitin family)
MNKIAERISSSFKSFIKMFNRRKFSSKVIACPRALEDYLISRIPGIGALTMQSGQSILVEVGQLAIITKGNNTYDVIYPGVHNIDEDTTPLIFTSSAHISNKLTGIRILYVANRNTRHRWGTPYEKLIERPGADPVLVKAYGFYSVEVDNLNKLVDFANSCEDYVFEDVHAQLRSMIVNALPRVLIKYGIKKGKSISEILADPELISKNMTKECQSLFYDFGIKLNSVNVTGISLSDVSIAQILGVEQDVFMQPDEWKKTIRQMAKEIEGKTNELNAKMTAIEAGQSTFRFLVLTIIFAIGMVGIFFLPQAVSWGWLLNHPHKMGLQLGTTILLIGICWILYETNKEKRLAIILGTIVVACLTLVQIM